ncbi:MAG TPA: glycosyltransferase [Candidatus Acidoferrales bacterium]|nr:glycosyltransferase [Candidatus Acidoferrales bacterium]
MSTYLFITWPGAGNQPPTIGIAQELADRGHQVTFAGYDEQRLLFSQYGFRFLGLKRSSAALTSPQPGKSGRFPVFASVMASPTHLEEIPELIAQRPYDAVVVDCLMFGALAAAARAKVPVAVLVHSAPGALMAPDGPLERLLRQPVNAVRSAAGLAPVSHLWQVWAEFPVLCTTVAELDPLAEEVPASCDFVGPVFESRSPSGWRPPWRLAEPRPMVLLSFSTGRAWDQTSRIARALTGLSGDQYHVLVTSSDSNSIPLPVPENAVVVPYVPHLEILPAVAVTVTHAGHGTVVASLAHGVPLVCLPNPFSDQPALAARVMALGAGIALDGDSASSVEIAAAVDTVLREPSYRDAAQGIAGLIAAAPGAKNAASRLEALAERRRI